MMKKTMMKKVVISSVLGTSLLFSSVNVPFNTLNDPIGNVVKAESKSFTDVPSNHWAYKEIMSLVDSKVISGYTDNTYRPNDSIRRDHVAVLMSRSLDMTVEVPMKKFADVPSNYMYADEIAMVQRAGIFDGGTNGLFRPQANLTRAQMAKILTVAFDLEVKSTKDFPDVPESHWANEYVRALYSNGITVGSNGKFKPEDPVTRAQYASFLHRALNMDTSTEPENPIEPPQTDDGTDIVEHDPSATYDQLIAKYGKHEVIYRNVVPDNETDELEVIDIVKWYHDNVNAPGVDHDTLIGEQFQFPAYLEGTVSDFSFNTFSDTVTGFPYGEMVSIQGKPFMNHEDTKYWLSQGRTIGALNHVPNFEESGINLFDDKIFFHLPEVTGGILTDIHVNSKHVMIAKQGAVSSKTMQQAPVNRNGSYLVGTDALSGFNVSVSAQPEQLTLVKGNDTLVLYPNSKVGKINGSNITLNHSVEYQNQKYSFDVKEVSEKLGLSVRMLPDFNKIQISNYEIGPDIDF